MASEKSDSSRQRMFFVGVACLMLIVVVGSVLFFMVIEGERPSQGRRATATATVKPPTPAPQPTPQILCYDYFVDNKNGWATGDEAGYIRTLANGQLILSGTNHKPLIESMPTGCATRDFSDFSLTLTFSLLQADRNDSVGLYLRGDSNLDHDYRISVFGDGTYSIGKEALDEGNNQVVTTLVEPTATDALHSLGKENTMTVMMKGSRLALFLNGKLVRVMNDTDYVHGQIALFVDHGRTSPEVMAMFGSIVVATAPEKLPEG